MPIIREIWGICLDYMDNCELNDKGDPHDNPPNTSAQTHVFMLDAGYFCLRAPSNMHNQFT